MPRAQLSDSSPQTDAAQLLLRVLLSGFSVSLLSYTVDASPSCTATKVLTTPQRRPSLLKRGSGSSPQTPSPGHSARCRCLDLDIRFCPEGTFNLGCGEVQSLLSGLSARCSIRGSNKRSLTGGAVSAALAAQSSKKAKKQRGAC